MNKNLVTSTIMGLIFLTLLTSVSTFSARASTLNNDWQLTITGLVTNPMNLSLTQLAAMPKTTVEATIYCVDFPNVVVATGRWAGVQLSTLFQQAGVLPSAIKVAFYAADGYATDLDLTAASQANVILAYEKDDLPLTETLRLVVPERWGYKWISQVTSIVLVDYDFKGKWESQGYSDTADIQSGSGRLPPQVQPTIPEASSTQGTKQVEPSRDMPPSNVSIVLPNQNVNESKTENQPQNRQLNSLSWLEPAIAIVVSGVLVSIVMIKHNRRKLKMS